MDYTRNPVTMPAYYQCDHPEGHRLVRAETVLYDRDVRVLHYHACTELGICLSGSGICCAENRIYRFSAGDMQFIRPHAPHYSAADPGTESRWCWVSLEALPILTEYGTVPVEALQALSDRGYCGIFRPEEYPALAALIRSLAALADSDAPDPVWRRYFLTGALLTEAASAAEHEGLAENASVSRLQPAILYIREHYADREAMRGENIAAVCRLRPTRFRELFRRETGMTMQEFILKTRLAAAAHLLAHTNRGILWIAMETGFGDISYFHRAFRQVYGQKPLAYRSDHAPYSPQQQPPLH